jgi:hypothetical protein
MMPPDSGSRARSSGSLSSPKALFMMNPSVREQLPSIMNKHLGPLKLYSSFHNFFVILL